MTPRRKRLILWLGLAVTAVALVVLNRQSTGTSRLEAELRWLLRNTPTPNQWNSASTLISLASLRDPDATADTLTTLLHDEDAVLATRTRQLLNGWPPLHDPPFAALLEEVSAAAASSQPTSDSAPGE